MLKKLIILGTSGNAQDVLDVVEAINAREKTWEPIGFLDDGGAAGDDFMGLPVLGKLATAREHAGCWYMNAIGSDASYRRRSELVGSTGLEPARFATLVHPMAGVSSRAWLGRGVCVNYGASIAGNVTIEDHVTVGPRCVLGHDSVIGAFSVLAAGAVVSGGVHVRRSCYLGAASLIRQNVDIGGGALIGMGAVVLRNVRPATTMVGNPARLLIRAGRKAISAAMNGTHTAEQTEPVI